MNVVSKPKPVLVYLAVITALDVVTAGAAFTDLVTKDVAAIILLVLVAVKAGGAVLLQGQVTPSANVVAYQPNPSDNPLLVIGGGASVLPGERILPVDKIETVAKHIAPEAAG